MVIVMARLVEEDEQKVLVEPYGSYTDWYDEPNDELHMWLRKAQIHAINDEEVDEWDDWAEWMNSEEALELTVSHRLGERLLA